ncbi:MAG: hypothetical protein QXL67_05230 [Candidatus Bathyarchaeia archaeon]
MSKMRGRGRKGISEIISNVILLATVITVGMSVWYFTYSVGSTLQRSYLEDTNVEVVKLKERFTVEHINFNSSTNELHVWIYNYGNVTIHIDRVYVFKNSTCVGEDLNLTEIPSNSVVEKVIQLSSVESSDFIFIEVLSERGNIVYEKYLLP